MNDRINVQRQRTIFSKLYQKIISVIGSNDIDREQ